MTDLLPECHRKRIDLPDTHLNVCKKQCKKCLFGKNPYLPWEPFGREKIEAIVKENQTGFTCHNYQNVMCRGYWQKHGKDQWFGRFAKGLKLVRWIGANDES